MIRNLVYMHQGSLESLRTDPFMMTAAQAQAVLRGDKTQHRLNLLQVERTWKNPRKAMGDSWQVTDKRTRRLVKLDVPYRKGDRIFLDPTETDPNAGNSPLNGGELSGNFSAALGLEITDVRVMNVRDIREADAIAEGMERAAPEIDPSLFRDYVRGGECDSARLAFRTYWEHTHGADAWKKNPLIVALSIRPINEAATPPSHIKADDGKEKIEIQELREGGEEFGALMGFYARGHHDPYDFVQAVNSFTAADPFYDSRFIQFKPESSSVRQEWWRFVPIADEEGASRCVLAEPHSDGAFAVTVDTSFDNKRARTSREKEQRRLGKASGFFEGLNWALRTLEQIDPAVAKKLLQAHQNKD